MEREVGQSLSLGVMLIALSILISIVWVTVSIGNNVKFDAAESADKVSTSISKSQLTSLQTSDVQIMPKAAVYNILTQEEDFITKLIINTTVGGRSVITFQKDKWVSTGSVSDEYNTISGAIAKDISGKVEVEVTKNTDGGYVVELTEIDY